MMMMMMVMVMMVMVMVEVVVVMTLMRIKIVMMILCANEMPSITFCHPQFPVLNSQSSFVTTLAHKSSIATHVPSLASCKHECFVL